jgi:hypothetical protein
MAKMIEREATACRDVRGNRLLEAFKLTPQSDARRRKALEKQAAALGIIFQPAAA